MENLEAASCFFCSKPAEQSLSLRKSFWWLSNVRSERVGNNLVYQGNEKIEVVMIPRCGECAKRHKLEKRYLDPLKLICGIAIILGSLYVLITSGFWKGVGAFVLIILASMAVYFPAEALIYGKWKKGPGMDLSVADNFPRVKELKSNGWKEGEHPHNGDYQDIINKRRGH